MDKCLYGNTFFIQRVTKVVVTICDHEGNTIEQGQATLIDDTLWKYATSAPAEATLMVEAVDLAGNITKYEA